MNSYMVYSLFRNGKETVNPENFRVLVLDTTDREHVIGVERQIWYRFIKRHIAYGGTMPDNISEFIQDAQEMGFSVQPISPIELIKLFQRVQKDIL